MKEGHLLLDSGRFIVGCNYWASHAGTAMWSDWRPKEVVKDFAALSKAGLQVLRVFPIWSDFQPIELLVTGGGTPKEYRFGEAVLPDDEAGRAGVSEEMMERFEELVRLAEQYHLKLIVSLLAGWMSGRLFIPPALVNRNVITDPVAIMWQVRFIKYFVARLKKAGAIIAWEPGNECNCMGGATREQAWVWSAAITDAIRSADNSRPVVSGMHGLGVAPQSTWAIEDQAELTDLLTTHPYPLFTPHCDRDPINTIRTCLHGTAESLLYAEVGGKPCLVEETGTLGPMMASETIAGAFARTCLFSLWAHDCHGLVWWCGFDQSHLAHAPYDWCSIERELGLMRADRTSKPVIQELGKFRKVLEKMPFDALPPRMTDAVCILTEGQDQWAAAYGSFILGKQAGLEMEFQFENQPLKEAAIYVMPSLSLMGPIRRRRLVELFDRVRKGATLYLSHQDGFISSFEEYTGLEVQTRQFRSEAAEVALEAVAGKPMLPICGAVKLNLKATRAQVLGRETDGNPAFTCVRYGKGKVYFLSFPIETELAKTPGAFYGPTAQPYWMIYQYLVQAVRSKKAVTKSDPRIGVTEHPLTSTKRVVVMINYSPKDVEFSCVLAQGWKVEKELYGRRSKDGSCRMNGNDAVVIVIKKG